MTKISALTTDSSTSLSDFFPLYDVANGATKKALISDLIALVAAQVVPVGMMVNHGGFTAPTGWLLAFGQAVSRATYSALYAILNPTIGTFTTTIAAPGVMTLASHGFLTGDQVYLTTTGALPTGLTANTLYYVVKIDANTFNLATSRANAYAATKITTTGTQSGTHSLTWCPFGLGDGSTTFNIPDTRGRILAGPDGMGGTLAARLSLAQSQGVYANAGAAGGEQGHQLITSELAVHQHTISAYFNASAVGAGNITRGNSGTTDTSVATNNAGGDGSHNNIQPTLITNVIIKT